MPTIRIRDEAEQDLMDAAAWYEQQKAQLGHEFLVDVQSLLELIADRHLTFPVIHRRIRRAVMHRFPFCLYFIIEDSTLVVIAVLHGSRHPRRWQHRT